MKMITIANKEQAEMSAPIFIPIVILFIPFLSHFAEH